MIDPKPRSLTHTQHETISPLLHFTPELSSLADDPHKIPVGSGPAPRSSCPRRPPSSLPPPSPVDHLDHVPRPAPPRRPLAYRSWFVCSTTDRQSFHSPAARRLARTVRAAQPKLAASPALCGPHSQSSPPRPHLHPTAAPAPAPAVADNAHHIPCMPPLNQLQPP
jgi:hypothetical protein